MQYRLGRIAQRIRLPKGGDGDFDKEVVRSEGFGIGSGDLLNFIGAVVCRANHVGRNRQRQDLELPDREGKNIHSTT